MPSPEFLQATALQQRGQFQQAASVLNQALAKNPSDSDSMQLLGAIHFQMGRTGQGRKLVEQALEIDPRSGEAWNSLGLMRHLTGDNPGALQAFETAVEIEPKHGGAWMNHGFVLQEIGRQTEAIGDFERAIASGLDNPLVKFFLGNAYSATGYHEKAVQQFDSALSKVPTHADALNNRGNSLLALGRVDEAVISLKKAVRLEPHKVLTQINLASAIHLQGDSQTALRILDDLPAKSKLTIEWLRVRSQIQLDTDRYDEAIDTLNSSLALHPEVSDTRATLAKAYQLQGRWRRALEILADCTDPNLQIIRALTLPVILESASVIEEARSHMGSSIQKIRESGLRLNFPDRDLGVTTFFLAYHGIGERDLQEQTASMYRDLFSELSFKAAHEPSKSGRTRLGVLSAHLKKHTIGKLFAGVISRLDPAKFEVIFLQVGKSDEVSDRLGSAVEKHVILPGSLKDSIAHIAEEHLDILLHVDVGMDFNTNILAYIRLAPVQCALWGHPMTTGSPEMDYFISSEHLERADGDSEYTEELIRLPSLTTYFERPAMPSALTRADFGLPEGGNLYACLQTLFKFHPDFDRVLNAILERDPGSRLVLIEAKYRHWREMLLKRWRGTYPTIAERAVFVPSMPLERYLALSSVCDADLDPIQYGGGNSSLECFAVGVPVVTLPQSLLRNRITYAAYRQIDFMDLVAEDEEDYIRLAHRLATDSAWRAEMRAKIFELSTPLFENLKAVRELEDFLIRVRP